MKHVTSALSPEAGGLVPTGGTAPSILLLLLNEGSEEEEDDRGIAGGAAPSAEVPSVEADLLTDADPPTVELKAQEVVDEYYIISITM